MPDIRAKIEAEIPRLRRYALSLTRDTTASDDLVQECLVRAITKMHLWQEGTNLRAWLFTILHNQYVNQVRRAVREGISLEASDIELSLSRGPTQDKALELRDLDRALAKLPEEQRTVILLAGLEGMPYEAVAEIMGTPVGTVRSRLSRGRDELRYLMGVIPMSPREREAARRRRTGLSLDREDCRDDGHGLQRQAPRLEAVQNLP